MPVYRVPQCPRDPGNRLFLGYYWKTSRATMSCWGCRKVNDGEASRAMIFNDGVVSRRVRDFSRNNSSISMFAREERIPSLNASPSLRVVGEAKGFVNSHGSVGGFRFRKWQRNSQCIRARAKIRDLYWSLSNLEHGDVTGVRSRILRSVLATRLYGMLYEHSEDTIRPEQKKRKEKTR